MKRVRVPPAEGLEEIEEGTIIDSLPRAGTGVG
jgi:hypothetical protein